MKTLLKFLFASISLALIFVGCDDDDLQDPLESIPTVQFESSEGNVSENGGEKTVTLYFNKPFNYNASIKVLVDTAKQKYFISTPSAVNGQITIAVNKGDTKATIKLKANDNVIADGTRPILFKITRLHNEFILGEKDDYTLLIEDNEGPGHAQDSYVNFIQRNKNINESSIDWHELEVHVSNYATALGNLTIMANSVNAIYGVDYITEPALNENKFILPASGNPTVKFRIKTINDDVIGGNSTLRFTIVGVDGNLKTGTTLQDSIVVNDDELSGMPKGYEIGGSFWGLKKTYEYRSDRQISKVTWESHTPYHRTGTNTYHYNHLNELTRINKSPGHDLLYQYNDGEL